MPEITEQQVTLQTTNVACGLESTSKRSMRALACEGMAHF